MSHLQPGISVKPGVWSLSLYGCNLSSYSLRAIAKLGVLGFLDLSCTNVSLIMLQETLRPLRILNLHLFGCANLLKLPSEIGAGFIRAGAPGSAGHALERLAARPTLLEEGGFTVEFKPSWSASGVLRGFIIAVMPNCWSLDGVLAPVVERQRWHSYFFDEDGKGRFSELVRKRFVPFDTALELGRVGDPQWAQGAQQTVELSDRAKRVLSGMPARYNMPGDEDRLRMKKLCVELERDVLAEMPNTVYSIETVEGSIAKMLERHTNISSLHRRENSGTKSEKWEPSEAVRRRITLAMLLLASLFSDLPIPLVQVCLEQMLAPTTSRLRYEESDSLPWEATSTSERRHRHWTQKPVSPVLWRLQHRLRYLSLLNSTLLEDFHYEHPDSLPEAAVFEANGAFLRLSELNAVLKSLHEPLYSVARETDALRTSVNGSGMNERVHPDAPLDFENLAKSHESAMLSNATLRSVFGKHTLRQIATLQAECIHFLVSGIDLKNASATFFVWAKTALWSTVNWCAAIVIQNYEEGGDVRTSQGLSAEAEAFEMRLCLNHVLRQILHAASASTVAAEDTIYMHTPNYDDKPHFDDNYELPRVPLFGSQRHDISHFDVIPIKCLFECNDILEMNPTLAVRTDVTDASDAVSPDAVVPDHELKQPHSYHDVDLEGPYHQLSWHKDPLRGASVTASTLTPASNPSDDPLDTQSFDEIYDIVDAVVPRTDDPTLPTLTPRVWVLGTLSCLTLAAANTLFTFRTNTFTASPFVGVIVCWPLGVVMERFLPRGDLGEDGGDEEKAGNGTRGAAWRKWRVWKWLNPGKFNFKEHTLIYVFSSSGANTAYALYNIIGQKYQLYQSDLSTPACITFAIVTQCLGYGLAGLCRRFLVRPSAMLWPANLSIVALIQSLHEPTSSPTSSSSTPRLRSRFAFYWLVTAATALYQFLPNHIAPILTAISPLCYLAPMFPDPATTRLLASAQPNGGVGWLSVSLDWNVITAMTPITSPLWALANQVAGMALGIWVVTPLLWANNAFGNDRILGADPGQGANGTGEFPLGGSLNSADLFNKDGLSVDAWGFVFPNNLTLNEAYYESQAPVRITTYFALDYATSFLVFTATFSHVALWYGKDLLHRCRSAARTLDQTDLHARLMSAYADVPDAWYLALLLISLVAGCAVGEWGGFGLPWWGTVLGLGLAVVSVIPLGVLQAISGQGMGLNVMSEILIGFILPGRIAAVMAFKTISYMAMYQGLTLVSDLKLGHYLKIPPRDMFVSQLFSTVIAAILNVYMAEMIYESFGRDRELRTDPSDPNSPFMWKLQSKPQLGWTANSYNVFLNAGAIWGSIGPLRFFGPSSPYRYTLLAFPLGLLLPLIPWHLHRRLTALSRPSYWHLVNVPLLAMFPNSGAGAVRAEIVSPLAVGVIVNYFIKKHRPAWWRGYAYVLSAGLDSGLAVALAVIFFGFQWDAGWQIPFPPWMFNRADGEICAPEFYLTCMDNQIWGGGFNRTYNILDDPYCRFVD
ncbi:hypothetical protein HK101_009677 [Irineochytrium annulatum]|nr:hypothetical protein HK101_009677 [Irineochytrium annulatum]